MEKAKKFNVKFSRRCGCDLFRLAREFSFGGEVATSCSRFCANYLLGV